MVAKPLACFARFLHCMMKCFAESRFCCSYCDFVFIVGEIIKQMYNVMYITTIKRARVIERGREEEKGREKKKSQQ